MSLINTIQRGNYELADQLITDGYGLNETNSFGHTPLILLLWNLKNRKEKYKVWLELITKLIDAGADVNSKDIGGNTALIHATYVTRSIYAVKMLIDAGAYVNIDGDTALIRAICVNHSIYTVKMLIDAGADVNIKNNYGWSALIYAVKGNAYSLIDAVKMRIEADF